MIRILHVDDDTATHFLTRHNLLNLDEELEFVFAESGKEAIEMLNEKSFDCIISDFQMPQMDGMELLKTLHTRKNETPFIFLTGQGNEKIAVEAFHSGADDYFTKEQGFAHYERILNSIKKQIINRDLKIESNAVKKELDKRVNELTALHTLNQQMISNPSLKHVVSAGIKGIVNLFAVDLGIIFLRKDDKLLLQGSYLNNPEIRYEKVNIHCVGECLCGLAVSTEKPIYCLNINNDPRCTLHECKKAGFISFAALPLNSGDKIIGVLGLASTAIRDFQANSEILETFSNTITIAMQNALLFEDVKQHESQLVNLNKEMEQFVDIVAHDLKSPVVTLKGFTKILENASAKLRPILEKRETQPSEKELESLLINGLELPAKYINRCASKMERLVQSVLEFSRVGRASFTVVDLDMNIFFSKVKSTFEYIIKEKNATVEVCDLPSCTGDLMQIDQIFSNLLSNALKYLDTGRQGFIRISGKVENTNAVYCVEDNGIGIPEFMHKRIFEIFHRVNPDFAEGDGLGLAIVNKIVSKHGGKVWVESETDKGSKFFVSLPKAK